jgi:hypothetical protein
LQARPEQSVLEPADLDLDPRQRLEQRVGHPVEDHVDDVAFAAPGGDPALGDELREVDMALVHGEQEVAVDEHVDPKQRQPLFRRHLLVGRAGAPEREHDQLALDLDLARRRATFAEAHEALRGRRRDVERGGNLRRGDAILERQVDPEELLAEAKLPDLVPIEAVQDGDPLRGHLARL